MLQCLRDWHVDSGEISSWRIWSTRIFWLLIFLRRRYGDQNFPYRLVMLILATFLNLHCIDLISPTDGPFCSTRGGAYLNFSILNATFDTFFGQYQVRETLKDRKTLRKGGD